MIQEMSFSFTADNKKALGTMTMLYKGLDLAIKIKELMIPQHSERGLSHGLSTEM